MPRCAPRPLSVRRPGCPQRPVPSGNLRYSGSSTVTRPISAVVLGLVGLFIAWRVAAFLVQARAASTRDRADRLSR
jgi:hypothetical protein